MNLNGAIAGARASIGRVTPVLALICACLCTAARADEAPVSYILDLAWAPQYCTGSGHAEECKTVRHFLVQGLWPVFDKTHTRRCVSSKVSDASVRRMLPIMPAKQLIVHEWITQGSCTGLPADAYFSKVETAVQSLRIPDAYSLLDHALETPSGSIYAAFFSANPKMPDGGMRLRCTAAGELAEVRVCLNTDLSFGSCVPYEDDNCGSTVTLRAAGV